MGSSFLIVIELGLAVYCGFQFLKSLIQFGLPNQPAKITLYLSLMCASFYFVMKAGFEISFLPPLVFYHWRTLPIVGGSLALLIQVMTIMGKFTKIQQKIMSRLPFISAILVFAFFPGLADGLFALALLSSIVFLSFSVGKVRVQSRILFKMIFFLFLSFVLKQSNFTLIRVAGDLLIFPGLFYYFMFQQTYGISAMIGAYLEETEETAV